MSERKPRWITGTHYGRAQLEILNFNGSVQTTCDAWVRINAERLTCNLAAPIEALCIDQLCNNSFPGRLTQLLFPGLKKEEGFSLQDISLKEVMLNADFDWDPSPLLTWPEHPQKPHGFPQDYVLLNTQLQEGSALKAGSHHPSPLYAHRYQLPWSNVTWQGVIALPNGNPLKVSLRPEADYTWAELFADQDWSHNKDKVFLALQLLAGGTGQLTQSQWNATHTLLRTSTHFPSLLPMVTVDIPYPHLLEHIIRCFACLTEPQFQRFRTACRQHLFAKYCDAPMETRFLMQMTFLEMMDGSKTLNPEKTAALLGIPKTAAKYIEGVRDKLIHQEGSLLKALHAAVHEEAKSRAKKAGLTPESVAEGLLQETQKQLGLATQANDASFAISLVLRISERIDTALWSFLNIPGDRMQRSSDWARWHHGTAPLPPNPRLPEFRGPEVTPFPTLVNT